MSGIGRRARPPRRYRDAGELPAAHAQGRRPPAALALRPSLAAANPSFPLGQLPTELQQQVLPHLDAESLAMLARTSKAMHAMVHGHPPTPGTFRAARFMSTLSAAGAGPLAPDLVELHACVEHFSKDQFQFLVAMALRESEAGFEHTDLLGPLLNKSSRHDAEQIAQALDKMDAPCTRATPLNRSIATHAARCWSRRSSTWAGRNTAMSTSR